MASESPYPLASSLRRAQPWQEAPCYGPSLERVSFHEASHVCLFEWLGLADLSATATATSGRAHLPDLPPNLPDNQPDPTGELAATAAAVFHAGVIGELIWAGAQWRGPIYYARHTDYQVADNMLQPNFGQHSSSAHSFAQRVALHVLSGRWARVEQIAKHLIKHGRWESGDS